MNMTVFADTQYRGSTRRFGISEEDRLRGVLVLGKAGMGKTQLVAALALQDIAAGLPVFLVDPDGTAIREVSRRIPESRVADVIRCAPRERAGEFDLEDVPTSCPIVLVDLSHPGLNAEVVIGLTEHFLQVAYEYALRAGTGRQAVSLSLYVDAAGGIIRESFSRFLKDARSLGIAVTLSARYLREFSPELRESFGNALATLGLFQLGSHDAEHFARLLSPRLTASVLSSLSPGMMGTNLMTDNGMLPVVVARGTTPAALGFLPREQSFELFRPFQRKELTQSVAPAAPEIPAAVLEAFLEVEFA